MYLFSFSQLYLKCMKWLLRTVIADDTGSIPVILANYAVVHETVTSFSVISSNLVFTFRDVAQSVGQKASFNRFRYSPHSHVDLRCAL